MNSREEFLKRLHDSESFKSALSRARSDAERKTVQSVVEAFVGGFADVLAPLIVQVQQDSSLAQKLNQAVNEDQRVITASEPASTSSTE